MGLKFCYLASLALCVGGVAQAQEACPSPDTLLAATTTAEAFYEQMKGPGLTKDEFETTEEFQARLKQVDRPLSATVEISTTPEDYRYNADAGVFEIYLYKIDPGSAYRLSYLPPALKEVLGETGYANPVQIRSKKEELGGGEYVATNAYGAETKVAERNTIEYVIFDNKGRKRMINGDDLFTERPRTELATLSFPVERSMAQQIRSELRMVAYVESKEPWAAEASYRSEPTRKYPTDRRTEYRIAFADIKCVGVLDGSGGLISHWVTR